MLKQGGIVILILTIMAGFFYCQIVLAEDKININTATLNELESLSGIGLIKATAIIAYREENGLFTLIEDIMNVSGIGPVTFKNIKDNIIVNDELTNIGSYCGDGNLDNSEECDDGNSLDGDGCNANCVTEKLAATGTDDNINDSASGKISDNDAQANEISTEIETDIEEKIFFGDVLINELVSDPSDGEEEWVELYNVSKKDINLNGWTLTEGSNAKTKLTGIIQGSGFNKFYIINKPKGNLNNKGDAVILREARGKLIDQIAYGNWDDGLIANNAPVATDPFSIARKIDGFNTGNNQNDFLVTQNSTPGASNIIVNVPETEEISETEKAYFNYNNNIIISEIFPNPLGADTEEFIELFNNSGQDINLIGWKIGDESKKRFEFLDNTIVKAYGYLTIYREESKLALNNTSDSVKLYQPLEDKFLQIIKYEKAREGKSYNCANQEAKFPIRNLASKCFWSEIITPGKKNVFEKVNHLPEVDFDCPEIALVAQPILFDSSDTIDIDDDKLEFFWDFGDFATNTLDRPEHTFFKTGVYAVKLIVRDGYGEVSREKIITIVEFINDVTSGIAPEDSNNVFKEDLKISEFIPNPVGNDEAEWIEIFNGGQTRINLFNWQIDDIEGGSRPFIFKKNFMLNPGQYFILNRDESGLALNNTVDAVRLLSPTGDVKDFVEYSGASEGEAYARGLNNKWFWTAFQTPGEENIIKIGESPSVLGFESNNFEQNIKSNQNKAIAKVALGEVHNFEIGDLLKTEGIVAVLPGILGTQYFYIVESLGMQIYNYKKDFPDLMIGDRVAVLGEISESNGERRLKIKNKEDIKIISHNNSFESTPMECNKINDNYLGCLLSVSGEIVENKGSTIFLDDGTDEFRIYIKRGTGINIKNYKEGEKIAISGLLSRTKIGLRLMPRSIDDIIKKDIESNNVGQVLGEIAVNDEWNIVCRDKKLELFKYLLVVAGSIITVLMGLLIKLKRQI